MKKVLLIALFSFFAINLFVGCMSGRINSDGSFTYTYHDDDYYDYMHTSDPPLIDL